MTRKHSYRSLVLSHDRREARLRNRADLLARRSARELGIVISVAQVAELREAINNRSLPETVRYMGQTGTALDAYAVDFAGVNLIALHDRRGQLVSSFTREGDFNIVRNLHRYDERYAQQIES